MKLSLTILSLSLFFNVFGQREFDFPIYIAKQTDSSIINNLDIDVYIVDSISVKVNNITDFFKFLKSKEYPKSCERIDSTQTTDISIDFVGFKNIRIGGDVYLVFNPFFDSYSEINISSKTQGNETISSVFLKFAPIFTFSRNGQLLEYPSRKSNTNSDLFLRGLLVPPLPSEE